MLRGRTDVTMQHHQCTAYPGCGDGTRLKIVQVEEFDRLQAPDGTTSVSSIRTFNDATFHTAEEFLSTANFLAAAGDVLAGSVSKNPLIGGLFSFSFSWGLDALGFGGGGGGPDFDALAEELNKAMKTLADNILKLTDEMIDEKIAIDNIITLRNNIDVRREWFLQEYAHLKHFYMKKGALDELDDLADDLLDKAFEYYVEVSSMFSSVNDPSDGNDSNRARYGMDLLMLSLVEALTMGQEGVLLQKYAHPDYTCDELIGLHHSFL